MEGGAEVGVSDLVRHPPSDPFPMITTRAWGVAVTFTPYEGRATLLGPCDCRLRMSASAQEGGGKWRRWPGPGGRGSARGRLAPGLGSPSAWFLACWPSVPGCGGPPRAVPSDAVVAAAARVLPADIVQKLVLLSIF